MRGIKNSYIYIYIYIYIRISHSTNTLGKGHCWRSKDELISDVLQWTPAYGQAKAGRPARTYIQQLCEDTGCSPEDLPKAMNDREKWRERVRDIRASGTTWWWWWWWWYKMFFTQQMHTPYHLHIFRCFSFGASIPVKIIFKTKYMFSIIPGFLAIAFIFIAIYWQCFGRFIFPPSSGVSRVACSDSVYHNWVQVISFPVLLLVWTVLQDTWRNGYRRLLPKVTISWRLQVQSWQQANNNTGILNTFTKL